MQYILEWNPEIQELIVVIVFLSAVFIQLVYYLVIFSRFAFGRVNQNMISVNPPVSVIICARNEAENLERFLPEVLNQDYEDFEVIVVNDCSTDDTEDVLIRMKASYPRLRSTSIRGDSKMSTGKKLALIVGIKAARNEHLLFTDADCRPESNRWISTMMSGFTGGKSIILGYGGYLNGKGFLNKYIRFDTLFIALQYFSFALWKMPYMGVGRNMAYKKSLFYSGPGFSKHLHLASGDDDLFVNQHATGSNTGVEFRKEGHTRSEPETIMRNWIYQKRRHFSTAYMYKTSHKFWLFLEPFSRMLFYASFAGILFIPEMVIYALIVFLLRSLSRILVIKKAMVRLNEKNIFVISLLYDLLSLVVNLNLYISNRFRPVRYQWK